MSVVFDEKKNYFHLFTENTEYVIGILYGKYPLNLYYGKKNADPDIRYHRRYYAFCPFYDENGEIFSLDTVSSEIPCFGSGDLRCTALRIKNNDGNSVTLVKYKSYRIFGGREKIPGLPYAEADDRTDTLELILEDTVSGAEIHLYYTVFERTDVISRYVRIVNNGEYPFDIEKLMPLALDLDGRDFDWISLYGSHSNERNVQRVPIHLGSQRVFSRRGYSSAQFNPFVCVCEHKASEEKGDTYGFNFVYSGNFLSEIEQGQEEKTRILIGLGDENFAWRLEAGEEFRSPEAVMTFTDKGIGQMSRNFHKFTRNHILPKPKKNYRSVVLNTWEGSSFDIEEKTMLEFAIEAKKCGIDMLVMDDGWFGRRNNDKSSLGDWFVNKEKFPQGLKSFVKTIKSTGIEFGIWIEPEMVNPDSDLFRAHPDWVIEVPGREHNLSRNQLVLDFSNPDVTAYLKDIFTKTLGDVPFDYIKWDCNRHLSDVGSNYLPKNRQKETAYRHMLGVYDLLSWFRKTFPDAVIETCSGGGSRYDLGMMKYGEMIWTSDMTEPNCRTYIQYGSMLPYPGATMSCHVSDPNGDKYEMDYRFSVAIGGMLGYEFNILTVPEEIKEMIPKQIAEYKIYEPLITNGDFYRLVNPDKTGCSSYYYVNDDNSQILLSFIQTTSCKLKNRKFKLKIIRADKNAEYIDRRTGKTYSGSLLREGIEKTVKDKYFADIMYLTKK